MNYEEETSNYDIRSIILDAIKEQRNLAFLELCYVIYEAKNKKKPAKKILEILSNQELLRNIQQIEALTEENENKIYYYEQDEYSPKKLLYKKELETTLRTIRNEQLKNLAKILEEINKEEEIEL